MPFSPQYDDLYLTIKKACEEVGVSCIRANEIKIPGPIINQIFDNIETADCIIAEVSEKNPNVYYEIGVAHRANKPTVLLACKESVQLLPFDIRHNRVLIYDKNNLLSIIQPLKECLEYIRTTFIENKTEPTIETYLTNLNLKQKPSTILIKEIIDEVSKNFNLVDARLVEQKYSKEGFILTLEDAFGERVVILLDINGIIKRMKKL